MEKYCTVFIAPEESQLTQSEIQKSLESGKMDDKIKALKSLVIQIIHDESFNRMVMTVINTLVPIQDDSHQLKKILLFYWEVIEKTHPNGTLKEEMILVCNGLRKDLLHPNEYIRGRTLKLLSRIQLRGILEPLQSAIVENVSHKHVYVRRNAIVCLYEIYLNFGDDLICDLDEMMEKFLLNETDLSARRNAFLLLYHANQQKALDFLSNSEEGDIFQLSILELFRKVCKQDPTQKAKLLKTVFQFARSKSPSVQYESANTLVALSSSLTLAVNIYMELMHQQTDNNIKLILLDRLEHVLNAHQRVLENKVQELTLILHQQSLDIRRKVLNMILKLVRNESCVIVIQAIQKELQRSQNEKDQSIIEFRNLLFAAILTLVDQFPSVHEIVAQIVVESYLLKLDDTQGLYINQIITSIVEFNNEKAIKKLLTSFQARFTDIQNVQVYKSALYVIGEFTEDPDQQLQQIKTAVGPLPIELEKAKQEEVTQTKIKTIILQDGTYGTQIVNSQDNKSKFREYLTSNSALSSQLNRTFLKLLQRSKEYNSNAVQVLLILLSLLRFYQNNQQRADQDTIDKLIHSIRILTGPNVQEELKNLNTQLKRPPRKQVQVQQVQNVILKQPDETLQIRQLRPQEDFFEEEAPIFQQVEQNTYVQRLNHIVQLTGYSDPIYAEAFINVHKYDIQFEVLFINRSPKMVQNVQVEFRTQGDSKILERAPGVTLQPNQQTKVKTSIKFSSSDLGVIFGSINYENNAGIEQPYLVTKEIIIDLIDFIVPSDIDIDQFRKNWAKYEWENRIAINTSYKEPIEYIQFVEKSLKLKQVIDYEIGGDIIALNLYAKTKLDDDLLVNISVEKIDDKLTGFVRIRSKVKGIVVNLGDKLKALQAQVI